MNILENYISERIDRFPTIKNKNYILGEIRRQIKPADLISLSFSEIIELGDKIFNDIMRTRVASDRLVGLSAAQSIGEKLTQSTLKSFQMGGVSSARADFSGLPQINEVLNISDNVKEPYTRIILKDRYTSKTIRTLIPKFKFTTLIDLVKNRLIIPYEDFFWYPIYDKLFGLPVSRPPIILRLVMDKDEIYLRKLSMRYIASSIEVEGIKAIFSDINTGYIDIWKLGDISSISDLEKELDLELWPRIASIYLGGVEGIKRIHPISVSLGGIKEEEIEEFGIKDEQIEDYKKLIVGNEVVLTVPISKLIKFEGMNDREIWRLDIQAIKEWQCQIPEILEAFIQYNPVQQGEFIFCDPSDHELILNSQVFSVTKQDLTLYWYLEADGNGIRNIWEIPEVDPTRTFSNRISEIYMTLGIEAVREFIIKFFMKNGLFSKTHISLLADAMILQGIPTPVTRGGMSSQDLGMLTRIGFEENTKNLVLAAAHGESDTTSSVFGSILVGNLASYGTGAVKLIKK